MQEENKYVNQVEAELKMILKLLESQFDKDYAKKNPDMVRHLMDKVQEQKYIELQRLNSKQ